MALNLEPVPENPAQKKLIATIVAGVAVLALALTLFPHRWLKASSGEYDAGASLFSVEQCIDGECESMTNKEVIEATNENAHQDDQRSGLWWIAGYATFGLILLSIAALVTTIVLVNTGKFYLGKMSPASLALVTLFLTLIVGMIFVGDNPTKSSETAVRLGVGWTFWVFGIGVVAGIVGTQMLNKFKPVDPAMMY